MMSLIRNCCLFHFITVLSNKFSSDRSLLETFLQYFFVSESGLKPDPHPVPEKFENRIRIRIHAKTPDPQPWLEHRVDANLTLVGNHSLSTHDLFLQNLSDGQSLSPQHSRHLKGIVSYNYTTVCQFDLSIMDRKEAVGIRFKRCSCLQKIKRF